MLIFLYGDDQFRSRQKVKDIKGKYFKSDKTGSGLSLFKGEEKDISQKIQDTISTPNLLAPKRLLIVEEIISEALEGEQKKVLKFLKSNFKKISQDKDTVIIFWENNQPKKNNALYKLLVKAKSQEFKRLSGVKLSVWVLKQIQSSGKKISQPALNKLIAYVGNDLYQMSNEIEKLVNFVSDYSKEKIKDEVITEAEVDLLVKAKLEANIFKMIDALAYKNKKKALELLHNQLKKGDDPFYIFSMYIYQFRNLLKIGDLYFQGKTNQYEIAKLTKMSPFVVQKGIAQLRGFTLSQLKKIYKKLEEIDLQVKTGKINIVLALDKFIGEM